MTTGNVFANIPPGTQSNPLPIETPLMDNFSMIRRQWAGDFNRMGAFFIA
jgi:hypothetical protein